MTVHPTTPWSAKRASRHRTGVWAYVVLAALIGLRLASAETGLLSYIGLGIYALFGRGYAIRALALSVLFTMINPGIAPELSGATIGRYIVLLGASASVLLHGSVMTANPRISAFAIFTTLLGLLIVGHSVLFSQIVDVSILKATSWTLAVVTLICCWTGMSSSEREETEWQLFWGLAWLLLLSLPLLVIPVGYLTNGSGFQGLLNQPQVFGTVMGLFGAWAATRMLSSPKLSLVTLALTVASVALVLMSETRTAGFGMVGGVALSAMVVPWLSGKPGLQLLSWLRNARLWFAAIAIVVAGIAMAPAIAETLNEFMLKRGSQGSLLDSYVESRGVLMFPMLDNINERPLTGIGFGIGSNYAETVVERDGWLGLPSSVPVEKGVTPIAVIEELGFVLAALVLWWLVVLVRGCARGGLVPFAVCTTVLIVNLGEATLFSPGGIGMLWLILLAWAYSRGWSVTGHCWSGQCERPRSAASVYAE